MLRMALFDQSPRRAMRHRYIAAAACFGAIAVLAGAAMTQQTSPGSGLPAAVSIFLIALTGLGVLRQMRRRVRDLMKETERSREERAALMTEDEITGALTRRVFLQSCEAEMRRIGGKRIYGLFALDMDYLKVLNDSLGHTTGDFALRHLVKIVRHSFPGAIIGRLGGDEFAVFCPVPGPDEAEALCRRCLDGLHRTEFFEGRPMSLSVSIGIALTPRDSEFLGELMHCADLALYESKRNGRGQATMFRQDFLLDRRHQRFIERELRAAILLDELQLAYQPVVGLDGKATGYEALLRWRHPVRGNIAPCDFIPIAEQSLLIDLLGEWVFRRALRDAVDFGDLLVGVNISPTQLRRDDVVEMVRQVLAETGFPPARVVLELTESVAMAAGPDILRRFQALRDMGLRLSLDDFGSGYCGFGYLRTLPVDTIKIDRSYIARLGTSEADDTVVAALASVAAAMGLDILAEGIETEEQLQLARIAGCRYFQGFHIARPMTKAELLRREFPERAAIAA